MTSFVHSDQIGEPSAVLMRRRGLAARRCVAGTDRVDEAFKEVGPHTPGVLVIALSGEHGPPVVHGDRAADERGNEQLTGELIDVRVTMPQRVRDAVAEL